MVQRQVVLPNGQLYQRCCLGYVFNPVYEKDPPKFNFLFSGNEVKYPNY